jgi:predicted nucleic acid-binding protein
MHLLARLPVARDALLGLVENGALRIALNVDAHIPELRRLVRKYRDQSMSLADACIVRMTELHDRHCVLTLDSDFLAYRKHGRVPIALIHPTQS